MADSKITALAALTAADPANDMVPIVDVSDNSMAASGTTKRISINNILACSPSATLASLNVTGSSIPANGLYLPTTNTLEFSANSLAQYRIAPLGVFSWYDGAGGTRMTLNSTGLGVGVTPSAWDTANYKALQVSRTAVASLSNIGIFAANWFADTGGDKYIANGTAARIDVNNSGQIQFKIAPNNTLGANQPITFTQAMTLDASGNLLVGKTSIGDSNVGVQLMPTAGLSMSLASQTNAQTTCAVYSTTAADYRFYVGMGGTVYATNTAISPITSDERLKQNIVDYDKGLEEVLALRPRHFEYKAEPNRKLAGFISQEVKTVIPDAIRPTLQDPEMMTYEIDWYPLLVKAIQELTARVQTLEAR